MAKKQHPVIYRSLAGKPGETKHLITQKDIEDFCGRKHADGSGKSFMQILFENPDHNEGLEHLAQAEAQALSRTTEGQMRLIAILMYIAEQKEKNRIIAEQLFSRLMLPKE